MRNGGRGQVGKKVCTQWGVIANVHMRAMRGGVKFLPFWCVFTKSVPSKLAECRHGYIDDRVMNSYQNCGVY